MDINEVRDMPPSRLYLWYFLDEEDEYTRNELVAETGMTKRTVQDAVDDLIEEGLMYKRPSLQDARVNLYGVDK